MPTNIIRFERLAYLAVVLGVIANVFDKSSRVQVGTLTLAILAGVGAAIGIALIYLTARRRQNWARWVFAVLVALAVVATGYVAYTELLTQPLYNGLAIASTLADVIALYFVFTGGSGAWFKRDASVDGGYLNAAAR